MTARPTSFRESSAASISSRSRRSSITSVRDIFSDDYALEPIDVNLNLSLDDLDEDDDHHHGLSSQPSTVTTYPAIPQRLSTVERPSSTLKGSGAGVRSTGSDGLLGRTLSTSSRISLPRSQSPYSGPTAPSHPYAMYPQVTRASSIASQSTFRPQERPFVHTGGPEHPYALYPQNTVVDDDDEDIGTQPIPLGFSALGYGSSSGPSTEMGDIVLSDGHIEQLPPYTRYADNVVAKGDMATINNERHVEMDTRSSERTTLISADAVTSAEVSEEAQAVRQISPEEAAKKQGLREKLHRRVCGGIALWLLLIVVVFIFFAGILGGVIGGIVGRKQGAIMAQASETAAAKATQTIFMDAESVPYDPNIPSCPTGKYAIPFGRTQNIQACVVDDAFRDAWGCLDLAYLGMTINRDDDGVPNVKFDDYSVNTAQFMYGPQPPDFNGTVIPLGPHKDKDNEDLGVAMFFYHEFDKLNILPGWALEPDVGPDGTQTVKPRDDVVRRGNVWDKKPLDKGDQVWYCFWNQTISEFWIFLEKPANVSESSTMTTTTTAVSGKATSTSTEWQDVSSPKYPATSTPTYPAAAVARPPWSNKHYYGESKRSYTAPYYPEYPKLIKMVEKRRPRDNVAPYCQKMQVLYDWRIVPRGGEKYTLAEKEWATDPVYTGARKKRDTTMQLESNCVCEWMSSRDGGFP